MRPGGATGGGGRAVVVSREACALRVPDTEILPRVPACALRSAAGPFRIAQIREISLINDCLRPLLDDTVLFHPP